MRAVITSVLLVVTFIVCLPAQVAQHRFGLDDFSRVVRVADPQFAPDGKSIAVVVSRANLDEDRYDASLVLVEVAKGTSRTLVTGQVGLSSPRWSPDGRRLAFLAAAPTGAAPRSQVFVVKVEGGRPQAITSAPLGVQHFCWSPDTRTIAFATADEPERKTGAERFNDSFEVAINDSLLTSAAPTSTHIWLVPTDGRTPARRLTSGTWSLPVSRPPGPPASAIVWTADSTAIIFARQQAPHGSGGNEIEVVKVSDGTLKPLNGLRGTFPMLSPSGDSLALMTQGNVGVAPMAGGPIKAVTTAIDRSIANALWMPEGKSLLVGGNDSTRVSMWVQPLDGPAKKVDVGDLSPNSSYHVDACVARDGAIAFTATSPTRPSELYYMASADGPVRRMTDVNTDTAALPLGRTEVVEWKNDAFTENGILTYPPDFSSTQKYPLVLVIHGGPRAASMLTFSAQARLLAAKGWLVFQPNYRGSDNLGSAYQRAISNDTGEGPGRDVMAGIDAVKEKGIVDEGRMAVSGWSYGGYMTTWMIGHYDVWKAAVAGAAVTDQLDQSTLGDGTNARGAASPWINQQSMERARAQSPITYASKMKAPTLILHNIGDYRVTITQSYKLFHALRDSGVTAQFIAYPITGHNAADPVRQRDVQRRWVEWLERYLSPAPPAAPGAGLPREGLTLAPPAQPVAPCTTATAACTEWVTLGGGPGRAMIYRSYSLDVPNSRVTRAVVMVHGTGRNADHYFLTTVSAAFLAGALDDTVVIAPHMIDATDHAEPNEVVWQTSWRTGGPARDNPALSSFEFVDEILRKLARKSTFPNLKSIVVTGHSAGGQFTNRYAMANKVHDTLGVPVSYVVANPSSYAWPVAERPLPQGDAEPAAAKDGWNYMPSANPMPAHTNFTFGPFDSTKAPNYNNWPAGLANRTGYTAQTTDDQLKKQLVERPTTFLLGQVDTLPLGGFDSSPNAMAQGPTRRARGEAFVKYVDEVLGAKHKIIIVPECGHNDRCMFTTGIVFPYVFPGAAETK